MQGLEYFVRAYLDNLLIIGKISFENHLKQLCQVLVKISRPGLKFNAKKWRLFSTGFE